MIALIFARIGWRGAAVAAAVVIGFSWLVWDRHQQRRAGAESARQEITEANRSAGDAADRAERGVLDCPPGKWDRGAGRCAE